MWAPFCIVRVCQLKIFFGDSSLNDMTLRNFLSSTDSIAIELNESGDSYWLTFQESGPSISWDEAFHFAKLLRNFVV